MKQLSILGLSAMLGVGLASSGSGVAQQPPSSPQSVLYEHARLIIGDGSAPIESGAFIVQNGHVTAIGSQAAVMPPASATHVDLTGKTVMPAMINVHVHIGYEGYTSWGAENYTPPERSGSSATGSVLWCRGHAIGRQQSDRCLDPVST